MNNILIILSIFLVPLSSIIPIKGTIIWYPQLICLFAIGLTIWASYLWKINKFIALILMYEVFSYVFITGQSPRTMLCLISAFVGGAIIYTVSNIKDPKWIYRCIVGMAILQSVYVLLQYIGIDFFFTGINSKTDVVGFVGSHNQLGAYYSSVAVLLTSINPLLCGFSIIPIFLAKQNSAIIGLVSGLLLYGCFSWRKKVIFIFIALILCLSLPWAKMAGKNKDSIMERVNVWKLTAEQSITGHAHQVGTKEMAEGLDKIFIANPITGFGLGKFFEISPLTQYNFRFSPYHRYEHAHNDIIEAWFELGHIGILLILLAISSVINEFLCALRRGNRRVVIPFCCLVSMCVSSLGLYIFHAPVSYYMFCLMLGLFYAEVRYENKSAFNEAT